MESAMNVVMIIAPKNYRAEELAQPRHVLEQAGHVVTVASTQHGECAAVPQGSARATASLREVDPARFDGVVFVGGPGARVLFDDPDAHRIAREATRLGKVVGAICIAPSILARAGVLRGKRVTCFPSETRELSLAGAVLEAKPVMRDDLLVTANGPEEAAHFGAVLITALKLLSHPLKGAHAPDPHAAAR
jgi:protease I